MLGCAISCTLWNAPPRRGIPRRSCRVACPSRPLVLEQAPGAALSDRFDPPVSKVFPIRRENPIPRERKSVHAGRPCSTNARSPLPSFISTRACFHLSRYAKCIEVLACSATGAANIHDVSHKPSSLTSGDVLLHHLLHTVPVPACRFPPRRTA